MKKLIRPSICILFLLLVFSNEVLSQAPEGIIYQAEARNNQGEVIANETLEVKVSILESFAEGTKIWEANHKVVTNDYGMFVLVIGTGNNTLGDDFDEISWDSQSHFLNVQVKDPKSKHWVDMGTTQFLSVPYALHAKTAGSLAPSDALLKGGKKAGVPSQNWSLFGNSKSDPTKDFLGTTDYTDLVMITNNTERLRITSDGDIKLRKSLEVGEDLTVKQNVYLNTVSGVTENNGPFTVTQNSPTLLTGTLDVDGATYLKNTLTVDGRSQFYSNVNTDATTITDKLIVSDEVTPNEMPRGESIADVRGLLTADSISISGGLDIGGNLRVHGDSTIIDHHLLVGETSNFKGQVTINTEQPLTGGESDYDAYPLRVEGSDQGIAIKVNADTPANKNNYVTFFDKNNTVRGRIEGETTLELLTNPEYIFDNVVFAADIFITSGELAIAIAEEVQAIAEGVSYGASVNLCTGGGVGAGAVVVEVVCPPAPSQAVTVATNIVLKTANLALVGLNEIEALAIPTAYNIFKHTQIGVTYQSGAGDYAEWLERLNTDEKFRPGDVVGVKAGKITLNTDAANNCMVVSSNPIVLGNMPEKGSEADYEKIAFMGQVPVKVFGKVNEGDYIIPSGNHDGFGIAVSPEEIKLEQIQKIVGIAWTVSTNSQVNYVNVAVGLNANDMALLALKLEKRIDEQSKEIDMLKTRLNEIDKALARLDPNCTPTVEKMESKSANITTENEENEATVTYFKIKDDEIEAGIALASEKLREAGVDIDNHPFFKKIKEDAEYKQNYKNKIMQAYDDEIEKRARANNKAGIKTIVQ